MTPQERGEMDPLASPPVLPSKRHGRGDVYTGGLKVGRADVSFRYARLESVGGRSGC